MQSMLECMDIKGSVITADAMHCQTKTSDVVIDGDGDYVLQVKENQKNLLNEIKDFFHKADRDEPEVFEDNCYNELNGEHEEEADQFAANMLIPKQFEERLMLLQPIIPN